MEIIARASFILQSPRKLRLVAKSLYGMNAVRAMASLDQLDQRAAGRIRKTLSQAIANAKNNFHLSENDLKIKKIEINGGPIQKRFQPVSKGMAHPIFKRMSHIILVLEGGENGNKN
jgi:large subunit ribosomal protein L22